MFTTVNQCSIYYSRQSLVINYFLWWLLCCSVLRREEKQSQKEIVCSLIKCFLTTYTLWDKQNKAIQNYPQSLTAEEAGGSEECKKNCCFRTRASDAKATSKCCWCFLHNIHFISQQKMRMQLLA